MLASTQGRIERCRRAGSIYRRRTADSDRSASPAIEDKIVQAAVVAILTPIYRSEFPGLQLRVPTEAQPASSAGCTRVRDREAADQLGARLQSVQSFFDKVSRDWLIRFVEHRIGDRRDHPADCQMADGEWRARRWTRDRNTEDATGCQVISPLLANIYLHQVYDQWSPLQWRQRCAAGDVIVVRYADDSIVGFEHRREAEQFLADLKARLARFWTESSSR